MVDIKIQESALIYINIYILTTHFIGKLLGVCDNNTYLCN